MLESPGMSHFEVKELVLLNMEVHFYMHVTVYIIAEENIFLQVI